MMWINRANRYGVLCFLTALLYAGFAQLSIAFAQSVEHEPSASNRIELIPAEAPLAPVVFYPQPAPLLIIVSHDTGAMGLP